jgi:hypothetical protein
MSTMIVKRMAWYQVPEVWLFMLLILATVIGTFTMMAMATAQPDTHLVVPNDVPRPSKIPPTSPANEPVPSVAREAQ